jgi:signal transduction histidine kinase
VKRRLLLSYLSLAAVVLIALEVPLAVLGIRREHDQLAAQAQRDSLALSVVAREFFEHPENGDISGVIAQYQGATGSEVRVLDGTGTVIGKVDPDEAPDADPFAVDIARRALTGKPASLWTHDEKGPVLAAAVPVRLDNGINAGAVMVAVSASTADGHIRMLITALAVVAVAVLCLTALVGLRLARSVTGPLAELGAAARRLGRGELSARAPAAGPVEVQALAGSFNDMAARLEELVAAQRRFVADASHQLRSPLTALRLRLENLELGADAGAAADLEAATAEVMRLSRLVNGLLTLTRGEGTRPERQVVDVVRVVEERREAWSALADERRVALTMEANGAAVGDPGLAQAVPGHLEQILDNVLANALDATPAGRAINLRLERSPHHVTVHVVDQGPGMTAEQRARAFDRFWQGPDRVDGSSGLGLAIVQQLVRANGGDVVLAEADGGGLDVAVTLETD